jgi:flagellar M-ring protein FliF
MLELWQRLETRARLGLVVGTAVVLLLVGSLAVWAYRPDYQVLFADLAPRDAAALAAELDKMKTPYQLTGDGNTILVPRDLVYKTRLKLMGQDVPLHGAVGFEVFNNADFGMTDFVQKVNYQRAIQGELTRTILSIEEVQSARVHLALPEQGLFKKTTAKPKASVTVTMKPGRALEAQQVSGIQRLVAASVPDIVASDVTVLDQHGVALTRAGGFLAGADVAQEGMAQLDSKRTAEDYIGKKIARVLDETFGAGEAIASVDLVLNLDQTKVTTDEVLPSRKGSDDESPTGVVVRERHTVREGTGSQPAAAGPAQTQGTDTTSAEAEYQVGRRVEQVSVAPGSVKRMTIAVVVRKAMTEEQREHLRDVVALAAGLSPARGDAIVVNTMDSLVTRNALVSTGAGETAAPVGESSAAAAPAASVAGGAARTSQGNAILLWSAGLLVTAAGAGVLALRRAAARTRHRTRLNDRQRAQVLADVRQWLQSPAAVVENER